jgi:hypothetical protein
MAALLPVAVTRKPQAGLNDPSSPVVLVAAHHCMDRAALTYPRKTNFLEQN